MKPFKLVLPFLVAFSLHSCASNEAQDRDPNGSEDQQSVVGAVLSELFASTPAAERRAIEAETQATQAYTRQAREDARRDAAIYAMETSYTHADAALKLLEQGNLSAVMLLYEQRLSLLASAFPDVDTGDIERQYQLATLVSHGDAEAREVLSEELRATVEAGKALGLIQ